MDNQQKMNEGIPEIPEEISFGKQYYQDLVKNNTENFIGLAKVPIGIAGPLLIHGQYANGEYFVPLATTEGTQVASTNRGMKVIRMSGGATVKLVKDRGIQRAPVFEFNTIQESAEFADDISTNYSWLIPIVESTTKVGKFVSIEPLVVGKYVHLRFTMLSGDAAGQNMVSVAVKKATEEIALKYTSIQRYWMDAGLSGEKIPSNVNILQGRGKKVSISVQIPADVLFEVTRAKPEDILTWFKIHNLTSMAVGWTGGSPSTINTIAALFIATGQDVGSVAESGISQTFVEYKSDTRTLYWEVTFPGIVAATYGGGTHLPSQRKALELMDCYGSGKIYRFCEIIAGTILAAEISLISSVCADEWVSAHDKYGRNR